MRKNQMSVTVKRFGDQVPKGFNPPKMPFKYYLPEDFDENEDESCKADLNNEMREDYPENYFKAIKKNW